VSRYRLDKSLGITVEFSEDKRRKGEGGAKREIQLAYFTLDLHMGLK
jgi:hypothetical protein